MHRTSIVQPIRGPGRPQNIVAGPCSRLNLFRLRLLERRPDSHDGTNGRSYHAADRRKRPLINSGDGD